MKKEIIIAGIMGVMSSPTFAQNFYQCTPCPAGTYAGVGASTCTDCQAGTYQQYSGQASCNACGVGQTSEAKATSCTDCSNKPANSHYTSNATSDSCSWACDSGFSQSGNLCCTIVYVYKEKDDSSYTLVATLDASNKTYKITWDSSENSQKRYIKSTEYHGQSASLSEFSIRDIISTSCTFNTYCNEKSCPSIMSKRMEQYKQCLEEASITISFNCY